MRRARTSVRGSGRDGGGAHDDASMNDVPERAVTEKSPARRRKTGRKMDARARGDDA